MSLRILLTAAAFAWACLSSAPLTSQEAAVQMVATEGEGARYWPRWRGPSGQGLVSGKDYPDTWSATQNVLWKTPLKGRGNSSPIVWG
ncbi:MAG: hypothetical protein ACRD1Q_05880, partial [Vicinamibacterales bacterium]